MLSFGASSCWFLSYWVPLCLGSSSWFLSYWVPLYLASPFWSIPPFLLSSLFSSSLFPDEISKDKPLTATGAAWETPFDGTGGCSLSFSHSFSVLLCLSLSLSFSLSGLISFSISLFGLLWISVSVSDLLSISVSVSCFVCGIVAAISRFFAALIFIAAPSVTVFVALIPVPAAWMSVPAAWMSVPAAWMFVPVVPIPGFVLVTSVAVILTPVFVVLTPASTILFSASSTSVPFEFILLLMSAELFPVPSFSSLMSQNRSSGSLYFLRLSVMILWYCSWMACEVRIPYSLYI